MFVNVSLRTLKRSLIRRKVPQVQQTIHCIVTEVTYFNILIAQNNTKNTIRK